MPKKPGQRGKELTPTQRAQIVAHHQAGEGYGTIAKFFQLSPSTVEKVVKRYGKSNTFESRPRSGRPPKAGPRDRRRIDQYIKRHSDATPEEIVQSLPLPVKARQVYNIRKELGYIGDKGVKTLKLSNANKRERVKWCQQHLGDKLDNAIFADEKPFEIGKRRRLIYRKANWARPRRPTAKYPEKISVYAAISRKGKSRITIWQSRQNSAKYCDTLERSLVPLIQELHRRKHHYYHDKDTTHTSRETKEWLKAHKIQHSYLPTNSPDINPLEYIWWMLDCRVAKHNPKSFEGYRKWIIYEWDHLTLEEINHIFDKTIEKLPKIIEAGGAQVDVPRRHRE